MVTKLTLGIVGIVLLVFATLMVGSVGASDPQSPLLHGTPDPNATPEVTGDSFHFEDEITFFKDVQPILNAECAGCHTGDGIGAATFLLDSPETIQQAANRIAFVTGIGYMPPWMPSERTLPIQHERRLSDYEIALLDHWAEDGAPLGDPADAVPLAPVDQVEVRHDKVLQIPEPYTPDDTLQDEYRCFALDLDLDEPMFMTGYAILPDAMPIAHHGILYRIPGRLRERANRVDRAEPGQGWRCFADSGLPGADIIGSWTPGMLPVLYPENTGFRLKEDDFIVLQIHYNLTAGVMPDQSSVALQLEPESPDMRELFVFTVLAPVELPCPEGGEGEQCERQYAVSENIRKYRDDAGVNANWLLGNCGYTADDFIDQDPAHVVSSCDQVVPFPLTAIEVLGHMHQKGTAISVVLNPDTPDEKILLDIPQWDFHWQGGYQWEEPVQLQRGDTVRLTCEWDNTQSDNPRYIIWGEGTDDEMCLTFITLYVDN